eukprot:jgi/Ulvmu1/11181/UM072_0017.1
MGQSQRSMHSMRPPCRMSRSARTLVVAKHCPEELRPRPPPAPPHVDKSAPPPPPRNGGWCLYDFALHKQLGVGATSVVFQGAHSRTGLCLALKVYFKAQMSSLNRHQVQRETEIHSRLDHPNVIAMFGAFEDEDHVVLLLEYAAKGDLFDMLRHFGGRMREKDVARHILTPFMAGLAFVHSHSIIHRDIKLENTLFSADGTLKIADFGLSVDTLVEAPVTRLGTLDYMSPEVMRCPDKRSPDENKALSELAYDSKVDTWACGVLAFELLIGCPPFGMSSRDESINAILSMPPKVPPWLPPDAAAFLEAALTKRASRRPTVAALLGHPWILSFRSPKGGAGHKPRSSGGLAPRLHAPACTSAPGAIITHPGRPPSPPCREPVTSRSSCSAARCAVPPPPYPRSATPPTPHSAHAARAPSHAAGPLQTSPVSAHAFAQPSPVAASGHRGAFVHPSGRRRRHVSPHSPAPSHTGQGHMHGPPDMIPRPASAFAAHTVHAGVPSAGVGATQPFSYHTVHATLQLWASEEMDTPPARLIRHAPTHANSHLPPRPLPPLPSPDNLASRSPSPDVVPRNEATLDSRMHHMTQLQSISCAPQHAACTQPPSPHRNGHFRGLPFSSCAQRMDHLPSAFLPPADLASPHTSGHVLPQSSNASGGGCPSGPVSSPTQTAHFLPQIPLRPHPPATPPVPARTQSGGTPPPSTIMHTATSNSLSPRSSASTSLYATHTTLASNPSCESPHASAQWHAGMSAGRGPPRHMQWPTSAPLHVQPQLMQAHLSHSPAAPHLHAPSFAAPVSPRRSEELAAACAACAAGLAQLQCGSGPQPVAPMPPLHTPRDAPDTAHPPDWVAAEPFGKRGAASRNSSKRSDLTVSSIEGSTTSTSLYAFEAPPSQRGAASTLTTSLDWANQVLMSSTSMDTMGVESEATGMMTTHTSTGTTTPTVLPSPRAQRRRHGYARQSQSVPKMAHANAHAPGPPPPLNLSAVAAVAGAAARQRVEWEALADTHSRGMHTSQSGCGYRRSSSSGSRRRADDHGHRRDAGRAVAGVGRGGGREPKRSADRPRRAAQSEIMPAEPRQPPASSAQARTHGRSLQLPTVDIPASIMWEAPQR